MSATNDLYRHAKTRIPGGTQLLSKRPEMFLPDQWPAYAQRARGCEVWDLDGRRYLDMTITAIGACPLGFADDDVNGAVKAVVDAGSMCTLNPPEEVELVDLLCRLHPWADMARFARSGGEAMSIAVRIARAATGRDVVAVCGYHGWHDWYLAANLASDKSLDGHLLPGLDPAGVPRGLLGTALPFAYNHAEELDAIVAEHGHRLAAVVMEPVRYSHPAPGFLEHCRAAARKAGAVLVFDEITAGFRMNVGGAHLQLGIEPDVAVFAKALGNGFPIAAIIGRQEVMQAAQRTFISSTNWTDRVGPAAAIATLNKLEREQVPEHLIAVGHKVRRIWASTAERHGIQITVKGLPPLSTFSIDHGDASLALSTIYTQEMLRQGVLASKGFYATFAHRDAHCAEYEAAADKAFHSMRRALDSGNPVQFLEGPLQHNGFRRLA
jgi:glutamate-1-semialdehyde 2,1-aminomutase